MLLAIAVLLAGIWITLNGADEPPSTTLTLVFGIVIVVLACVELLPGLRAELVARRRQ